MQKNYYDPPVHKAFNISDCVTTNDFVPAITKNYAIGRHKFAANAPFPFAFSDTRFQMDLAADIASVRSTGSSATSYRTVERPGNTR